MNRLLFGGLLGLGLMLGMPAGAAGPARNLLVELRWVESGVSGAALAGVREGATVVGTAGSVSPRAGLTLGTQPSRDETASAVQRIVVLNGHAASVSLSEQQPVQWLDYELQAGRGGGASIYAAPRSGSIERLRAFVVTPRWPGGAQPVVVEFKSVAAEAGGQAEIYGTVQAKLGDWITVARSGGTAAPPRPAPGVLSSSDAEARSSRELQLRVSIAP